MAESRRNCELCANEAIVYCPSDSAFLCATCDVKVHSANFLVGRHVRMCICTTCGNVAGERVCGLGILAPEGNVKVQVSCATCSPQVEDEEDDSISCSSSCVSSTGDVEEDEAASTTAASSTSLMTRKRIGSNGGGRSSRRMGIITTTTAVDVKVEGVLVNWCRKMGMEDGRVVKMAVELLSGCVDKMTVLPFRVSLAGSFWVAIRLCWDGGVVNSGVTTSTCRDLRTLEQISGVPAKLILATESRLARVVKRRRSLDDHEEGWAEC